MGPVAQNVKAEPVVPVQPDPASIYRSVKPPSRAGKIQFGGYLSPEAKRQLDVFAALNGRTIQSLFEEMVDDFSRKHGLHRLVGSSQST